MMNVYDLMRAGGGGRGVQMVCYYAVSDSGRTDKLFVSML